MTAINVPMNCYNATPDSFGFCSVAINVIYHVVFHVLLAN